MADDNGRQSIEIGHLSDSGDLMKKRNRNYFNGSDLGPRIFGVSTELLMITLLDPTMKTE